MSHKNNDKIYQKAQKIKEILQKEDGENEDFEAIKQLCNEIMEMC
jgi:hypothetical protein